MSQSTLPSTLKTFSVLPDNKSALERALELSLSQQLYTIAEPFPDLLNPEKTSPAALPYLAVERQVSEWSTEDTLAEKRTTVQNQWPVFRLSGTVSGIKLALAGLSADVEFQPWHAYGGEPYHMRVTAWLKKAPSSDTLTRLSNRITESKSERDVFDRFGLGFKTSGTIYAGGVVMSRIRITTGPHVRRVEPHTQIYAGGAVTTALRVTIK